MKHEDWVKTLKSDKGTYSNPDLTPEQKALDEQVRKHIQEKGKVEQVEGIYGDSNRGCSAYIEYEIRPEGGGVFTKFYGCSILYQGTIVRDITDRVATIKRVILEDLRLVVSKPVRYVLPTLMLAWRKILGSAVIRLLRIYDADLIKWELKEKELSAAGREILRVGLKIFARYEGFFTKTNKNQENHSVRKLMYCLVMLMEGDHAYFHRFRDAFSNLNKENPPRKEILRITDILIEREKSSIVSKFKLVRKLLFYALLLPEIKNLAKEFIQEVNVDKIKLDEADMYFNLNRRLYDFGGRSFKDRYDEFGKLNKMMGNVILP
mgnify:CR=1 FL=1